MQRNLMALVLALAVMLPVLGGDARAQEEEPAPAPTDFQPSDTWVRKEWKGFSLSIPDNWATIDESGWGLLDQENFKGVVFKIMPEDKHVKDMPPDKEAKTEELGDTWVADRPATGYMVVGDLTERVTMQAKAICLDDPEPDGTYLVFTGAVLGMDWADHRATMERIFSSITRAGSD